MFAAYAKIRPPMDDLRAEGSPSSTRRHAGSPKSPTIPLDAPGPSRSATRSSTRSGGVEYVYFADPYPLVRVRADVEDLLHLERYEAFTCLLPGSRPGRPEHRPGRRRLGPLRLAAGAPAARRPGAGPAGQVRRRSGRPTPCSTLRDVETGRPVVAHRGSVYWNDYRGRWVMIAVEIGGRVVEPGRGLVRRGRHAARPLGLRPEGRHPRRVQLLQPQAAPHVRQGRRPDRSSSRGRTPTTFSGNTDPTPRYDYNQVDVQARPDRPPPQPARPDLRRGAELRTGKSAHAVAFFALDGPGPGTIAVGELSMPCRWSRRSRPRRRPCSMSRPARTGGRSYFVDEVDRQDRPAGRPGLAKPDGLVSCRPNEASPAREVPPARTDQSPNSARRSVDRPRS